MKKQNGFTLIELMIVVAVIGVLSAIAVPQYQKYVSKTEVASALVTLTGVKTNVEASAVENGKFPAAGTEANLGVPQSMDLGSITFSPKSGVSAAAGSIAFTFNTSASSAVSSLVSGKSFELTRDTTGKWDCKKSTSNGVSDDLLPKSCK